MSEKLVFLDSEEWADILESLDDVIDEKMAASRPFMFAILKLINQLEGGGNN